jgi:PucR C-terminal helix-turn-helix domain/Aminotransferase class-III
VEGVQAVLQAHRQPLKHKVISRAIAYHGTPHGALAITGLPNMKNYFEPVAPGGFRVPNTNIYRHPEFADDPKAFGRWAADRIEEAILFEGPDTVAAVFLEPVQNSAAASPRRPATSTRGAVSAFARAVQLSRPGAYARLDRLRSLLGADLGHARNRLSLHLALLALHRGTT